MNAFDAGGSVPDGRGVCGACGEDAKLARPRRKRLANWEGP